MYSFRKFKILQAFSLKEKPYIRTTQSQQTCFEYKEKSCMKLKIHIIATRHEYGVIPCRSPNSCIIYYAF